ncbi:6-phosphogluconolactonase [Yoonia maritima]|uniref:6-phosphogluconolactonase n=1 Tax=Yoonia maritima TaxID=1435347 RepID=A0A2T0W190_9RHOB|nr:6-phosphogluconolactonase [Yoonia maritima]PRY78768.1 6-phosphogluconolactonase [Yoonia maritima]
MKLLEYPDAEMMMMNLADTLAGELKNALLTHDTASLAVPGGTTPGPIFDSLCSVDLDWSRVHVMLTDERWVPEDSERSNTRLLRQRLLVDRAAAAQYMPLYAKAETPEEKLPELAADLDLALPISVCLLGMGADMHTASIFPGADRLDLALNGDDRLVAMRAPGALEPRITLSAAVLNAAISRHIVIVGTEKRAALERAQQLTPSEAPVAAILNGATVHWAEK